MHHHSIMLRTLMSLKCARKRNLMSMAHKSQSLQKISSRMTVSSHSWRQVPQLPISFLISSGQTELTMCSILNHHRYLRSKCTVNIISIRRKISLEGKILPNKIITRRGNIFLEVAIEDKSTQVWARPILNLVNQNQAIHNLKWLKDKAKSSLRNSQPRLVLIWEEVQLPWPRACRQAVQEREPLALHKS